MEEDEFSLLLLPFPLEEDKRELLDDTKELLLLSSRIILVVIFRLVGALLLEDFLLLSLDLVDFGDVLLLLLLGASLLLCSLRNVLPDGLTKTSELFLTR